jgi:hypothetical protein
MAEKQSTDFTCSVSNSLATAIVPFAKLAVFSHVLLCGVAEPFL